MNGSVEKRCFLSMLCGCEFWLFWFACDFFVLVCFAKFVVWTTYHYALIKSKAIDR